MSETRQQLKDRLQAEGVAWSVEEPDAAVWTDAQSEVAYLRSLLAAVYASSVIPVPELRMKVWKAMRGV